MTEKVTEIWEKCTRTDVIKLLHHSNYLDHTSVMPAGGANSFSLGYGRCYGRRRRAIYICSIDNFIDISSLSIYCIDLI